MLLKMAKDAHGNTRPEFRVRVCAQAKTSAPAVLASTSLPVPFHVPNFDATTSQTLTRIEQTHLYEASTEQWYYVDRFVYDLNDYLLSSINGAL